ncbi:phosphatidylglycerophosphatase A [Ectothiorhodospiraceae bacterium WFHF3C12]|nr:phosphatidylglycerophosphatase A [Ectothiorhodospiraceae bacterium WFHF3C12]
MKPPEPVPFRLCNPVHCLALGFGTGLAPRAPGTVGTLVGIPLYLLLQPLPVGIYLAVLVAGFLLGIHVCQRTAADVGVHDHPAIVWDEVIGYLVTMTLVPASALNVVAGFVLFRFFDVLKPPPIRAVDRRVHGGFGIMFDDVLAGLYAALCLQLLLWSLGG